MEQDIVAGGVGSVAAYDVKLSGGKLIAVLSAPGSAASAQISVSIDAVVIIDLIEKAVDSPIPDAILELIKAALLK